MKERLLGDNLLQLLRLAPKILDPLLVAARAVSPASRRLPASRNSFEPAVIKALSNALAPAYLGNAVLAAQPIKYNVDFILGRMMSAGRPANPFHNSLRRRF
jgi:hypothetical protein